MFRFPLKIGASLQRLGGLLRRLHRDECGATSTEYLMIMVFVVMPIALMFPLFIGMVRVYGQRVISLLPLPFP